MVLNLDEIANALLPLHQAIERTDDRNLRSTGIAMHGFMDGAKKFSGHLARTFGVFISEQDGNIQDAIENVVLASYHETLLNFADEARRYVARTSEVAESRYPEVEDACHIAEENLRNISNRRDPPPRIASRPKFGGGFD